MVVMFGNLGSIPSPMCVPVSRSLTESVGPVPGRSQIKRTATLAFPFFLMDVFVNVHA